MIFVILSTIPDSLRHLSERLPPTTTVADLRRKWIEAFRPSSPDLEIRSQNGETLDLNTHLTDLPMVAPGSNIVHLVVVEPSVLNFRISPGSEPHQQLSVLLSSSPSELLPHLRHLFRLKADQNVRLIAAGGAALDLHRPFHDQGVAPSDVLTIEVELQIHPRNQWHGDASPEAICCFPSDVIGQTLTSGLEGSFQLLCESRPLSLEATIGEAMRLDSAHEIDHWIDVYAPRTIAILTAEGVRQVEVLPDSTLASLGIVPAAFSDGSLVPTTREIARFDTLEGRVLVSDLLIVTVDFGEHGCHVVRVGRNATVGDLRDRVATIVQSQEIALLFKGRCLDDCEASLSSVGIGNGARIQARKEPLLSVSLKTLSGRRVVLETRPGVRSVSYDDLRAFHASAERRAGHPCCPRWRVEFRCDGCRRRIVPEENGHQLLPAPCCKQKSLHVTAARQKDTGAQTLNKKSRSVETQTTVSKYEDKHTAIRTFTEVGFDVSDGLWNSKEISVQCAFNDHLPDLLQKVAKEAKMDVNEFGFLYQYERSYFREGRLIHFTEQHLGESMSSESKFDRAFVDVDGEENSDSDYYGETTNLIYNLDDLSVCRGHVPIINIDLTSVVMEFDTEDQPKLRTIPGGANILKDPRYVAYIHCLRVTDRSAESPEKFYVTSEIGLAVDLASGKASSIKNAVAHIPVERRCVERVFVLLRHGSRLPKWPIRSKIGLVVAIREGSKFKIEDGVVSVTEQPAASVVSRRWICYKKQTELSQMVAKFIGMSKVKSV